MTNYLRKKIESFIKQFDIDFTIVEYDNILGRNIRHEIDKLIPNVLSEKCKNPKERIKKLYLKGKELENKLRLEMEYTIKTSGIISLTRYVVTYGILAYNEERTIYIKFTPTKNYIIVDEKEIDLNEEF